MENHDKAITACVYPWRRRWQYLMAGSILLAAVWGVMQLSAVEKRPGEALLRVEMKPMEKRIDLMGTIVDSGALLVAAPIDSKVMATHFVIGQRVEQGQPLLTIDVADVALRARMARLELAKAAHRFEQLRNWEQGIEVNRARRLAGEAEQTLAEARQRLAELDTLLAKGIVSRLEHEAGQRQVKQAEAQYHMLDEELAQTLKKGSGDEREIARMEMLAAEQRAMELEQLAASGVLKAGRSGVILEPARTGKADEAVFRLTAGSPLVKGKPLFRIIDGDSVKVTFKLNEIDVNRVHIGQAVEMRSDGFTGVLRGTISDIAAVGDSTASPAANVATFEVQALAPTLDDTQRRQVRLGMSASVAIIESARFALVVPLRAIGESQGKPVVTVADPGTGKHAEREIATGAATADGVEILAGLRAGETVVLR